jgi:hypothetical protein
VILSQFAAYVTGAIPVEAGMLIVLIGYIVSPVVAAILSGKFGDNKAQSFLGWFTTTMICSIILIIGFVVEMVLMGLTIPIEFVIAALMEMVGIGVVYGLLYGSFALLMAE